jgi:hypothetical protein
LFSISGTKVVISKLPLLSDSPLYYEISCGCYKNNFVPYYSSVSLPQDETAEGMTVPDEDGGDMFL